ncbi:MULTISPECIES: methyltransferase [unclassified Pseudomonas]|uniref:methyltransferase n=1 Tax=unclassified Pseudomonas TaxID=196821 RepID=UPI0008767466|nr:MULTISPECIES: methyltransferase [unclassified Pseudomonas]SCZ47125.1 pyochelin synthetase [Pseudomonas sp. NFACC44-2]SDA91589.1 pyochelin synthetase [Pseudomonas sp. NFACC51]SDW45402.1 pyochelin synthetase [Pseudomonas sp. NFACC08-1]SFJ27485.1 pyochelin synthetase [Pseudomonas sp. NFACC54]SFT30619.1 pyochelin synthetase [Pseudomonas sp. NFACC48-1]
MTLHVDILLTALPVGTFPWHLPALTDLGTHQRSPARLLAIIERQRPAVAVMNAEQLERLLDFPALPLTDLSHLEQLLFVTAQPGDWQLAERAAAQLNCRVQGFTETLGDWRDLVSVKLEQQRWRERALGHPDVNSVALHGQTLFAVPHPCEAAWVEDHLDETEAALNQQFSTERLVEAARLNDRLGHAALLSMLNGLDHCGLLPAPLNDVARALAHGGIAPGHRALIARWLDVLQGQGLLRRESTRLHPTLDASTWGDEALEGIWTQLTLDWTRNTGGSGTLEYARENARQLPALMRGDCAAVHLLFPQGRTERAAALYRESLAAQYQHRAVAHWVGVWAAHQPAGVPLRVLEVGAGTGATTHAVLPALVNASVDYLCTDVSRYFCEQAAKRLHAWPWVRHGVFDIDRPALAQGYRSQSWDLIIAGGVLNAARDTERSLATLFALLKPGGWLVFSEPTQEEFWVMASQAFMLNQADDERQYSSATFLNLAQWQTALARAGFQGNRSLPATGHPLARLGHRVFVAQVPAQRLSRAALAAHLEEPALSLELPDQLPDDHTLALWARLPETWP